MKLSDLASSLKIFGELEEKEYDIVKEQTTGYSELLRMAKSRRYFIQNYVKLGCSFGRRNLLKLKESQETFLEMAADGGGKYVFPVYFERRQGMTIVLAATILHKAIFSGAHGGAHYFVSETKEMSVRVRNLIFEMFNDIPMELNKLQSIEIVKFNQNQIEFSNGSKIFFLSGSYLKNDSDPGLRGVSGESIFIDGCDYLVDNDFFIHSIKSYFKNSYWIVTK